uniref:Uncharacterized protein n=1 Tax=Sinocyclocheilus rhinocerous TaxID=307959 RepID=A0A673IP75_9TELE
MGKQAIGPFKRFNCIIGTIGSGCCGVNCHDECQRTNKDV